ncbi:DUF58 domain-containing protein [Chitinivibrio alkaliphilus]|uniref:DUF58 domain-containing protein n=1 Tax=Chitinivibrio alkaliphilus ACht1 TaxID=1313304 RepID=U7DC11_9BACT|nr:DUF58 domain-containing protein [Chitinivibrio alkaliphilus]ERP39118.1 hypothetical protein CALK_0284 [Chitinivibrio alkaliphilus ACht1]
MLPREVLRSVRRIEITTRSMVDSIMGGEYKTVFKGNGMEFADVRPYIEGDDVRSIDWNVTARTGEPYIKKNEEERELTVLLAIDMSASEDFGTRVHFKSRMIAELGALLGFSAIRNNDQVGLVLFTDRIERFIPPRKGRKHVLHLIRELLYFRPRGTGTDITAALRYINSIQKRKAVLFLVSDFLSEFSYERSLQATARRHDLIAVTVEDRREYELPAMGLVDLVDPETGKKCVIDTGSRRVRDAFARKAALHREKRQALLKKNRIDTFSIDTERGYAEPLISFFHRREVRA